ncbi:ClpXP adapter SpxH family protein [Radiobacillus deserti]|uniref:ClpXP adapter protein SpxH n=1 Tax=Radiobacillus deserti TaxID=2594883 RepID=A0A516KEL6_9BACI|nr:ClpXP adapter SpxH family protein [Radiobacillus deserti]QDP39797.1 DsbA family protein [Radiobacillus deserti]
MSHNPFGASDPHVVQSTPQNGFVDLLKKPVEIYVFIDPLCPECWSLEPSLKKLSIEYGRYFTIRPILSGQLTTLNKDKFDKPKKLREIWEKTASRTGMSCDGDLWLENPISFPWIASIAIKAAELQGLRAGRRFLRKVQESLFLDKKDISKEDVLTDIAQQVRLDVEEFTRDLYSTSSQKALQCDLKLTKEMDVEYIPTLVFFNENQEEEGLKISGLYPYEVYVKVLKQMLEKDPSPAAKPEIEDFVSFYDFVGSNEISVVFDWSDEKTAKEMKKLKLKQVVEEVPVKYGTFWRYIGEK